MTGAELRERVVLMTELARQRWLQLYRLGAPDEAAAWYALERALQFQAEMLEVLRLAGRFVPGSRHPWPDEPPTKPDADPGPDDGGTA